MNTLQDIVIIIPALDPEENLTPYCESLFSEGFRRFLLVDDGSADENKHIFQNSVNALREKGADARLLVHPVNKGKGRALKDAFADCAEHYGEEGYAVITADSDGQHLTGDVKRIAEALLKDDDAILLGSRDFTRPDVPPRSKFGNILTSRVFRIFLGLQISDTQTGLRGIPAKYLREMTTIRGERFEYETRMFVWAKQKNVKITELPIETVYENGNAGTHFNPFVDSFKIYGVIFGSFFTFAAGSLMGCVIDLALFSLFLRIFRGMTGIPLLTGKEILLSTVLARFISAAFHFLWTRKVVFASKKKPLTQIVNYIVLMLSQMCASGILVTALDAVFRAFLPTVVTKMIVDTTLFFVSYFIQKRFIF